MRQKRKREQFFMQINIFFPFRVFVKMTKKGKARAKQSQNFIDSSISGVEAAENNLYSFCIVHGWRNERNSNVLNWNNKFVVSVKLTWSVALNHTFYIFSSNVIQIISFYSLVLFYVINVIEFDRALIEHKRDEMR